MPWSKVFNVACQSVEGDADSTDAILYPQQFDRRTLEERFTLFGAGEDAIILDNLKLSRFKSRAIPALNVIGYTL